jgi:hypothetical protein
MAVLQIKAEYLPSRCEICHQTDYFDAKTNYCSRCERLHFRKLTQSVQSKPVTLRVNVVAVLILTFIGSICGAFVGLLIGSSTIMGSHWWKTNNWPIILVASWTLLGQIGLPLAFTRNKINIKIISRISLWSISGAFGSILGPLLWGVVKIIYREGTIDICTEKYIRLDIIWAVMFGIIFGPFCGNLINFAICKYRNKYCKQTNAPNKCCSRLGQASAFMRRVSQSLEL